MKRKYNVEPGGILSDCFERVRENFYDRIDENVHAAVYHGTHDLSYAEPEFTGKYLDLCAYYYETEHDERALKKGLTVINAIRENMRGDGYIGTLSAGNEYKAFSVWNQGFTLYGISRMYEVTGRDDIRQLMTAAADWIVASFSGETPVDILDATNNGTQHLSVLYAIGRVFLLTHDRKYRDFLENILAYCETTNMNLLSFDSILNLRSRKGIEMLVIYLGVLQYGLWEKNDTAVLAAKRYWKEVYETQIRNTGNGSLREFWTEGGNAPRLLPTEEKPNETCVAVGWLELSLALCFAEPKAEYLDAIEQTVFNHMLGSLEKSGADLAYYQGNFGKKIFRTASGLYQCCRYRGFTFFSYLKEYLYRVSESEILPILYCPSKLTGDDFEVEQKTDYPKNGTVSYHIRNKKEGLTLKLRIPRWCDTFSFTKDGKPFVPKTDNGFAVFPLPTGECEIVADFSMTVKTQIDNIDGKRYASATYGPLLLAQETRFGNPLFAEVDEHFLPLRCEDVPDALVHFAYNGVHFVDFSSAGKENPLEDAYTVFVPVKK